LIERRAAFFTLKPAAIVRPVFFAAAQTLKFRLAGGAVQPHQRRPMSQAMKRNVSASVVMTAGKRARWHGSARRRW
jgi:hypothetical protein